MENCHAVVEGEEFLRLEFSKLQEVLASDDLNIDSEDSVLDAAMLWLNSDLANRDKHNQQHVHRLSLHSTSTVDTTITRVPRFLSTIPHYPVATVQCIARTLCRYVPSPPTIKAMHHGPVLSLRILRPVARCS